MGSDVPMFGTPFCNEGVFSLLGVGETFGVVRGDWVTDEGW